MSADGDHQRTIDAVVKALQVAAHDMETRFEDWSGLLNSARVVIEASDDSRRSYLYGEDEGSDEQADSTVRWARQDLQLDRCQEFSPRDHRCELRWEDHYVDDFGRHHQTKVEEFFHYPSRTYRTSQERWATAHRPLSESWGFQPSDFGLTYSDRWPAGL